MPSAVNDFEMEPMLKSVAVVTRAWLSRPRKPYPFSSTILPSLINASATPETLSIDMRRSIRSSAAGRSAAGTECDLVTTATATQTAHAASRRPLQLRIIIFGPIITIRFWREGAPCAADLARMKPGRVPLAAACGGSLSAASSPHRRPLSAPCCRWQRATRSACTRQIPREPATGGFRATPCVSPVRRVAFRKDCVASPAVTASQVLPSGGDDNQKREEM